MPSAHPFSGFQSPGFPEVWRLLSCPRTPVSTFDMYVRCSPCLLSLGDFRRTTVARIVTACCAGCCHPTIHRPFRSRLPQFIWCLVQALALSSIPLYCFGPSDWVWAPWQHASTRRVLVVVPLEYSAVTMPVATTVLKSPLP